MKNATNATRRCNKPNNYGHINSYWASNQQKKVSKLYSSMPYTKCILTYIHALHTSVRTMQHYNDIVDCEDCSLLVLLDLSAAFDTVDHAGSYNRALVLLCMPYVVWLRASECGSVTSHGMGRWCSSQGWDSIALTALWLLLLSYFFSEFKKNIFFQKTELFFSRIQNYIFPENGIILFQNSKLYFFRNWNHAYFPRNWKNIFVNWVAPVRFRN